MEMAFVLSKHTNIIINKKMPLIFSGVTLYILFCYRKHLGFVVVLFKQIFFLFFNPSKKVTDNIYKYVIRVSKHDTVRLSSHL